MAKLIKLQRNVSTLIPTYKQVVYQSKKEILNYKLLYMTTEQGRIALGSNTESSCTCTSSASNWASFLILLTLSMQSPCTPALPSFCPPTRFDWRYRAPPATCGYGSNPPEPAKLEPVPYNAANAVIWNRNAEVCQTVEAEGWWNQRPTWRSQEGCWGVWW